MTASHHFPFMWRFRLLRAIHARGSAENRKLLRAWARAEGGTAAYNPLNTTEPWPGSTNYNSVGVRNYPTAAAGIAATAATLVNGHYDGLVANLRAGSFTARQMVERNAHEFDVWGTGSSRVLALL